MKKPLILNIPINKIDEEERKVWGYATVEEVDSHGEIVSYEASKKAFVNWVGNIREMHNADRAVGKKIDVQFDDENKGVWLGAYISESADGENAWVKIREGVLTGFSIGGKIKDVDTVKVDDKDHVMITDYDLFEVSVVDNPSAPSARLEIVKSVNGHLEHTEQMRKDRGFPVHWFERMYKYSDSQQVIKRSPSGYNKNDMAETQDLNKNIFSATELVLLGRQLADFIWFQEYQGKDGEALKNALDRIKDAAQSELGEDENWPEPVEKAIDLALNEMKLTKDQIVGGSKMSTEEQEIEKTVVGQEDRDNEGNVTATAEENTPEVAPPNDPAAEETEEEVVEENSETEGEDPASDEDEKPKKKGKASKKAAGSDDATQDLAKSILSGVEELIDSKIAPIQKQVEELGNRPADSKGKAGYVVEKNAQAEQEESADKQEFDKLLEKAAEYAADPSKGNIQERVNLGIKIRKMQHKMSPASQAQHNKIRAGFQTPQ